MKIIYDPKSDLKNWLRIKEKYPDNFTITKYYPFNKNIDLVQENDTKILNTIKPNDLEKFNKQADEIKAAWGKIETTVLDKIFKYLGKTFHLIDFTVNLTTAYYMPYDEIDDWFMIPTHKPLGDQLKCIAHELFHLYQAKLSPSLSQNEREAEVEKFLKSMNGFTE